MRRFSGILVFMALILASGCVNVTVSDGTRSSTDQAAFVAVAHGIYEEFGFTMKREALLDFVDLTCDIVDSGTDADFETYIRGVLAGDPPLAFKEASESVARLARTNYC